ncbi:hypothetical protein [Blastochloris tepida]|uniref:Uncharacterized protein n=1 Tax=Blastochloris tepida TaxID=2233851 RepID=A0A348FZB4_9HYPH|nr:hypothetical protein [Blastochloris tepida]BBF92647.1 hypothetical protein BLTE_13320 [Blastochloris tepida]
MGEIVGWAAFNPADYEPANWLVLFHRTGRGDPRSLSFKLVGTLAAGEFRHVSALGYVGAETWVYVEPAWSKLAVYVMDDAAMGAAMHRLSGDVAILKVRNRRGDLKPSRWFTGRWCVPTIAQLVGSSSGALRPDALWRDLISEGAEIVVHGKRCQLDYGRPEQEDAEGLRRGAAEGR